MGKKLKLSDLVQEETRKEEIRAEGEEPQGEEKLETVEVGPEAVSEEERSEARGKSTTASSREETTEARSEPEGKKKAAVPRQAKASRKRSQTTAPTSVTSSSSSPGRKKESGMAPKYLQLVRKEARLREDQVDDLTLLARELNRQKEGGERITENTLIRVAVDLLLERKGELAGEDEEKLRESLK